MKVVFPIVIRLVWALRPALLALIHVYVVDLGQDLKRIGG
jgi:hypothetical protein